MNDGPKAPVGAPQRTAKMAGKSLIPYTLGMTISRYLRNGLRLLGSWFESPPKPEQTEDFALKTANGFTVTLRARSSDRNVYEDIWEKGVYDVGNLPWPAMKTIVDIGAHVGFFALYAAARAPEARVIAFEPESESVEALRRNVTDNGLTDRVRVEATGVAARDGTRTLHVNPGHAEKNSSYRQRSTSHPVEVPVVGLATVFETHAIGRCDLLKINCEGEEYEMLYTLPDELMGRIGAMLINYHLFSDDPTHKPERLKEHLEARGFSVTEHPSHIFVARRRS